jgi:hypothetical protein
LELFLTPLQFVYLFCNLSKSILLFFSCTSSTRVVPEVPDLTKKKKHFGKKCLYFSTVSF